jgi:hypothetical protein
VAFFISSFFLLVLPSQETTSKSRINISMKDPRLLFVVRENFQDKIYKKKNERLYFFEQWNPIVIMFLKI